MDTIFSTRRKQRLFAYDVRFEENRMIVCISNGDEIPVPLAWYPKLYYATPLQLSQWRFAAKGTRIKWTSLNEVVTISELVQ